MVVDLTNDESTPASDIITQDTIEAMAGNKKMTLDQAVRIYRRAERRSMLCSMGVDKLGYVAFPYDQTAGRTSIQKLGSFGYLTDYCTPFKDRRSGGAHDGIDIVSVKPVLTSRSFRSLYAPVNNLVVLFSGWTNGGYGFRVVLLDPTTSVVISVSHLSKINLSLRVGTVIPEGTYLGVEGHTGCGSCGVHTHLETFDVAKWSTRFFKWDANTNQWLFRFTSPQQGGYPMFPQQLRGTGPKDTRIIHPFFYFSPEGLKNSIGY